MVFRQPLNVLIVVYYTRQYCRRFSALFTASLFLEQIVSSSHLSPSFINVLLKAYECALQCYSEMCGVICEFNEVLIPRYAKFSGGSLLRSGNAQDTVLLSCCWLCSVCSTMWKTVSCVSCVLCTKIFVSLVQMVAR